MTLQAIKWENGKLEILDQLLLPHETKYIKIETAEEGFKAIKEMKVRGAPAIAITACLSVAADISLSCQFEGTHDLHMHIEEKLTYLSTARPTAVNLRRAMWDMIIFTKNKCDVAADANELKNLFINRAIQMLDEDLTANESIGDFGAKEILKNLSSATILTHCNTGSLATAGYGTALGVIRSLHKMNKLDNVYCTETRPYNQGARLTAYELVYEKIPGFLICDDMVGAAMKLRNISAVVVGADRIAANGDTANKIGTYQIAILAKHHGIPFYIAASSETMDMDTASGDGIKIEERPEEELTHLNGVRIAAEGMNVWNPAFDVTPAELITGIITEFGVFEPGELRKMISVKKDLEELKLKKKP